MTEREIQRAIFAEYRKRRMPKSMMWAVPNGPESRRVPGFCAGASDIMALVNGEFFALELKTEDGKPSVEQLQFADNVNECDGFGFIAYGFDSAMACLVAWGIIRKEAA